MKFIMDFLNSGTAKQQNQKKLGALLICITAALLVVALTVLAIVGIATAIKNKNADEDGDGSSSKIPTNYVDPGATLEGWMSNGNLLLLSASNGYKGASPTIKPTSDVRAKVDDLDLYRGDYSTIYLTQETLDQFNAMMLAFHEEKNGTEGYGAGNVWLDGPSALDSVTALSADTKEILKSGTALIICDLPRGTTTDTEVSIYDAEAGTGKGAYKWLYEHAGEYGFVQASDVEGEEHIFRYVGVVHAKAMETKKCKTVAEYVAYLKKNTSVEKQMTVSITNAENKKVQYTVYYLAPEAETKLIPDAAFYDYTISGDNESGYILTVTKKATQKK